MISRIDTAQLGAQDKAALIYAQARSELAGRLWRAALGDSQREEPAAPRDRAQGDGGLDTLIALLGNGDARSAVASPVDRKIALPPPPAADADGRSSFNWRGSDGGGGAKDGLGINIAYQEPLNAAAERTGVPAAALAAIIHAESAKGPDGRWLCYSRNPRSSAAGLGQFLSGTWIGETEQSGTWLNAVASSRGWLDERGRVLPEARSALLALRYDGTASIQTIADYARTNLGKLRSAGVTVGNSVETIAGTAYVGHYLGLGDAIRFLKDELTPDRARMLLRAQIGVADADERIARAGSATQAHRDWFLGHMSRNFHPARYAGLANPVRVASRTGLTDNL